MKSTSKVLNDQDALRIVKETLNNDLIERYEVISVTSNPETSVTTVIVSTGVIEIALEINSHTGSMVSKERLAR